jgi:hypothetical protein
VGLRSVTSVHRELQDLNARILELLNHRVVMAYMAINSENLRLLLQIEAAHPALNRVPHE